MAIKIDISKIPQELSLIRELSLDGYVLSVGTKVLVRKINNIYKIFHRTGWWTIDASYFE